MVAETLIGRVGTVSGRVRRGLTGEVLLEIRGGTEAFSALPAEPDVDLRPGERALVIEQSGPRTVFVVGYIGVVPRELAAWDLIPSKETT